MTMGTFRGRSNAQMRRECQIRLYRVMKGNTCKRNDGLCVTASKACTLACICVSLKGSCVIALILLCESTLIVSVVVGLKLCLGTLEYWVRGVVLVEKDI
jgi:hypothetical protein